MNSLSANTISRAARVFLCAAFLLLFAAITGQARAGSGITVHLSPETIGVHQAAVLTVTITGARAVQPQITLDEGLYVTPVGTSSQYEFVNGRVSLSATTTYRVSADQPGDYEIGPITASINGRTETSRKIALSVTQAQPPRTRNTPANPTLGRSGRFQQSSNKEKPEPVFMRLVPEKRTLYVGEVTPVTIQAYFVNGMGASINSLPEITSPAFVKNLPAEEPVQQEVEVGGISYTMLSWTGTLSAVKEGEFDVAAGLDATLMIREPANRRISPFGGGIFDDDFFSGFFSRTREKEVDLASKTHKMRVLPLPVTGRPAGFNGAVGRFTVTAKASAKKAAVGDPVTLTMRVAGEGNFDRVQAPRLIDPTGFRTYTPGEKFLADTNDGQVGEKVFEQALVCMDPEVKEIPGVEFAYFDTKKKKYLVKKTKPIKIEITGQALGADQAAGQALAANQPDEDQASEDSQNQKLLPAVALEKGTEFEDLRPLFTRPWFAGLLAVPFGFLLLGLLMIKRGETASDRPRVKVKKEIKKSVRSMERAVDGRDAEAFFQECKKASQKTLAQMWGVTPEAITPAEVRIRLDAPGICGAMEQADAAAYSGKTFTYEELCRFRDQVKAELRQLEGC